MTGKKSKEPGNIVMLLGNVRVEDADLTAPYLHKAHACKGDLKQGYFDGSLAQPIRFSRGRVTEATVLNMWSEDRGHPIEALISDVGSGRKPPRWAYRLQDATRGPDGGRRVLAGDGLAELDCCDFKMVTGWVKGGRIKSRLMFRGDTSCKWKTGYHDLEDDTVSDAEIEAASVEGAMMKIVVKDAWDGRNLTRVLEEDGDVLHINRKE